MGENRGVEQRQRGPQAVGLQSERGLHVLESGEQAKGKGMLTSTSEDTNLSQEGLEATGRGFFVSFLLYFVLFHLCHHDMTRPVL